MRLFPLALMVTLFFAGCSSSKKNDGSNADSLQPEEGSHRLAITVNVDGNLTEWPAPLPGYSKETALHFGVTNNNDFLFIAVACAEDPIQRKMLRTGMEIYISESGKKETVTGIEFPLPSTRTSLSANVNEDNKMGGENIRDYKTLKATELTQLETFGLKKSRDTTYPLSNKSNLHVAYSWSENNFFNIEYAIPLKELFADAAMAKKSNIQVGFKLNGFSNNGSNRQQGTYASGSRGGGMRGAGGGMRGGGMRGGGGMRQNNGDRQGTNNRSEMVKDQSFWTKYTIS